MDTDDDTCNEKEGNCNPGMDMLVSGTIWLKSDLWYGIVLYSDNYLRMGQVSNFNQIELGDT